MAAAELKLRKYIRQILKESLVLESARGAALAAVMARALADQIIADLPNTGILYYTDFGNRGKRMAYYIPGSNSIEIIGVGYDKSDTMGRVWYLAEESKKSHITKIAHFSSFSEYGGNCIILGTGFFQDNPRLTNNYNDNLITNQAAYEEYGKQFLNSRITNEDTREDLLKAFGSAAAIGYFVAMFVVFLPIKSSGGSLGHVHAETVEALNNKPILRFRDNIMTVSGNSSLHQVLSDKFDDVLLVKSSTGIPHSLPKGPVSAQAFGQTLHMLIAGNSTYIHELQHLLQHAVYNVPAAAANPISAESGDVSNPNHPLHPYYDNIDIAEAHGIAKAQRPKNTHINIMSDLLQGAGLITNQTSEKIPGLSSPGFVYNTTSGNYTFKIKDLSAQNANTQSIAIIGLEYRQEPYTYLALNYLRNTYLGSIPSAGKEDSEEREAQLARFGSVKEKKAVARKYRRFVADIFAQAGFNARSESLYSDRAQRKNNPDAQRSIERGKGPMTITYQDALSGLTDTQRNKIQSLNSNKGNISDKDIKFLSENGPKVIMFSKALNISLSPAFSISGGPALRIDWLEKSGIDSSVISDLKNFVQNTEPRELKKWSGIDLPEELKNRILDALELRLVVSVPLAQGNRKAANRRPALVASTGRLQSTAPGVNYMGKAWYIRANGYVWDKLKNEYNAEFVQTVAGFLYSLYLLNDPQTDLYTIGLDIVDDNQADTQRREQLLFALLNENINGLKSIIEKLIRKSRHAFGFSRSADKDFVAEQQDQIRRLAIQLIETMQGITDEELRDVKNSVFSDYNRDKLNSNKVTPAQSSKYEKIIQDFINNGGLDNSPVQVAHSDLIMDFSLKLLGWLGNKFIG